MSHPDRMISAAEVRETVFNGEIIEEYLNDARGESALVLYINTTRAIHVVCSPKAEYLAIITAYVPATDQWSEDYRVRS